MSEESPAEKQPARKQKMRALVKGGTRIFLIVLARKALDLVFEWLAS